MNRSAMTALATAGAGIAAAVWMYGRRRGRPVLAVTINRPLEEVVPDGRLPDLLSELTYIADVRVRAAPGAKGTEVLARLRESLPAGAAIRRLTGDDPRQPVRAALRDTKALLETGEVVRPEPPTTHPTPAGRAMGVLTRRAREEGRL
jgi:hypothetical protein